MDQSKRLLIQTLALGPVFGSVLRASNAQGKSPPAIKAIAFDAFPIFDPRPVFGLVNKMFPAQGKQFGQLWRTRIFEYTWLLASSGKYQDFWACIDNALAFTAKQLNINLTADQHTRLMNAFLNIKSYPDVKPILKSFKKANIKLAFLSNMTEQMLHAGITNSGLEGYFDHVLSTDRVKTFKPHPRAYQLGVDTLGFERSEIVFTAFASWDAIGAKWFGYPTVWINRLGFNPEALGITPDKTGKELADLELFVLRKT